MNPTFHLAVLFYNSYNIFLYSFTAPDVIPPTMYFWPIIVNNNNRDTGKYDISKNIVQ